MHLKKISQKESHNLTRCFPKETPKPPTMGVPNSTSKTKGKKSKGKEVERENVGGQNPLEEVASPGNQPPAAAEEEVGKQQRKRSKCPGIRVVGGRIYDSENGKTCHQCRQKTRDFTAECKYMKKSKPCTLKFCHKCLLNRYGESAEETVALVDWHCPKCRGICNCSFCMKKRGCEPTGILVRTAKATGFSSVSQMLENQGPDTMPLVNDAKRNLVSPKKIINPDECQAVVSPSKQEKENAFGRASGASSGSKVLRASPAEKKYKKVKDKVVSQKSGFPRNVPKGVAKMVPEDTELPGEALKDVIPKSTSDLNANGKIKRKREDKRQEDTAAVHNRFKKDSDKMKHKDQNNNLDFKLPQGTEMTNVAGIDLSPKDVGNALQILEFCATFGEILGVKKGQAESVIRDIMGGRGTRRGKYSTVVQFHIQLLTLLQKDFGEETPSLSASEGKHCWLNALKSCLLESECHLKDFVKCINEGNNGYNTLDCSQKLRLLAFLCDETLGTMEVKSWIEDQNFKFIEKQKEEAKAKLAATQGKEKMMKQKLQDEIAKALLTNNGAPLTMLEHQSIVSKIKAEASKAHADMVETMGLVPRRKQRSDAMRTEPVLVDAKGNICWRLKGYNNSQMVLQVCGPEDPVTCNEKWFSFNAEEEKLIEKHLHLFRVKRTKRNKDGAVHEMEAVDSHSKLS